MKIELVRAESSEIIRNMFQYYIYDMSEYTKFCPNEDGTYTVDESIIHLNDYWTNSNHHPYLIMVDYEIAGFSLIRAFPFAPEYYDIGQFFILRKYKGMGLGRKAFELSVKRHPGKWITRVLPDNQGAYSFWMKVITDFAIEPPEIRKESYVDKEMLYFYYEVKGENQKA